MSVSQRKMTFGEFELKIHEELTQVGGDITAIFREYKNRVGELTSQNQQLMADLAREKVKNSKEPEPKVVKKK